MAIPFNEMKNAYKVLHLLNLNNICSFPPEFACLDEEERINPIEEKIYRSDKKSDNGAESLFFFIKNPTNEFLEKWNKLKTQVSNSSFDCIYTLNNQYHTFGWF